MPTPSVTRSAAIELCFERIRNNIPRFGDQFPLIGSGNKYVLGENNHWMAAFWTGELWLAYAVTRDAVFRNAAEQHLASFRQRLDNRVRITHDVGFLYTLSARAQWQLIGEVTASQLAIEAADALVARFQEKGGYIQAWGEIDDPVESGRFIVDCMMNIPLLYWASQQTGDKRYAEIANIHATTNMRYIVREDGSTAHTFFMDIATGEPIGQRTHQGYSDESLWSRGQAWAIYGFALAHQWSGNKAFLDTAVRTADRFLAEISSDYIPLWDFRLPPEANHVLDTSAGAIAAMGMIRLSKLVEDEVQAKRFMAEAEKLIDVLLDVAFDTNEDEIEGLLRDSTYHANIPEHAQQYTLFGDYFFLEALLHLNGNLVDFWGK